VQKRNLAERKAHSIELQQFRFIVTDENPDEEEMEFLLSEASHKFLSNEYVICFRIMLPITKPAFASMAILCSMGSWNNLLWPMLVYRSADKFTLPIGLNTLLTPYGNNYDVLIAGSMFSIVPVLIVFLCFQSYFIEGMTTGAVKG